MMDSLIKEFPAQLREALEIGRNAEIRPHSRKIEQVLVCGMGGSGIGADVVAELIKNECEVPYISNKGYLVPAFAGEETLVICSSYSGNTEEVMSAFAQLEDRGCKIVCVASGGKLKDLAMEHSLDFIQLPAGKPAPRACLGYSFVQQLWILNKLGLIGVQVLKDVEKAVALLENEQDEIITRANHIANFIGERIPVIYVNEGIESVALRWRQQFNENSKKLCWHNVIPEMNHNELVGWKDPHNEFAVLLLRNALDFERNQMRMDINKEILNQKTNTLIEVQSRGNSLAESMIYLMHMGDWISWFLSELREDVDAVEIEVIDYLKNELAKA